MKITVNSTPLHPVSRDLYMQFMEPLGKTDGSVEAGWDFEKGDWREDFIRVTRELAPSLIRFGGVFSSYYKWQEGVGPTRTPVYNVEWGGLETNAVGTHEFVDFCRRVGAEPFFNVNFESDGNPRWAYPSYGPDRDRRGFAEDAAAWVAYCNDPDDKLRRSHGHPDPYRVGLWEIGNETSYHKNGFTASEAAKKTVAFARAMKAVDPTVRLMGWGGRGFAREMLETAGEYLELIDYHNLYGRELKRGDTPLLDEDYRRDPAATWAALMKTPDFNRPLIDSIREDLAPYPGKRAAICESHYALRAKNRGQVLSTFAAGAGYARMCNLYEKNGDVLAIANTSDFSGNLWMVNSVMFPTPPGWKVPAYLMPVGIISALFSKNMGTERVFCDAPTDLDIAASRDGDDYYLHIVNTSFDRAATLPLTLDGKPITEGETLLLKADPLFEVGDYTAGQLVPETIPHEGDFWTIPAASVSVVHFRSPAAK